MTRTFPMFYGTTRVTEEQLRNTLAMRNTDPEVVRRIIAMMHAAADAGVDLGVGTAWRDNQLAGFRERHYTVTCPGGDIVWDGKCWKRHSWAAPMAPPGFSYHEPSTPDGKALAADMVPAAAWDWMEANCHRFGLRTFRHVNNEPWHIQPVEIPTARRNYNPDAHHPLPRWPLPGDTTEPPQSEEDDMTTITKWAGAPHWIEVTPARPNTTVRFWRGITEEQGRAQIAAGLSRDALNTPLPQSLKGGWAKGLHGAPDNPPFPQYIRIG